MCQAGSPPPPCLSTARSRRLPRSRPCVLPGTQAAIGARSWALVQRHLEGRRWAPEACSAQRDDPLLYKHNYKETRLIFKEWQ